MHVQSHFARMCLENSMAHFPMSDAFVCMDCAQVGDNSRQCACCGSQGILSLSKVFDRRAPEALTEYLERLVKL